MNIIDFCESVTKIYKAYKKDGGSFTATHLEMEIDERIKQLKANPLDCVVIKADPQAVPNGGRMELEDQVWKKFAEGLCHEKTRDTTFTNMFKWIKEDYEKKIKWFMELANVMQVEGYTDKAIMSIDVEAWTDYYYNKLTPEEALYEDNTNV